MSLIVTAGDKFLDIDAFGGCVAHAELLRATGIDARAISTAPMNESIPLYAKTLGSIGDSGYNHSPDDRYVIIDVSEPEFIDTLVDQTRIDTIIDHHLGYEEYWKDKVTDLDIELVGAACTQVYERWCAAGLIDTISTESAQLLSLGILDNTLNFKAGVCTQRDINAYQHLLRLGGVSSDWDRRYFEACSESIMSDVRGSLNNDTKIMHLPGYAGDIKISQLVLWDAGQILDEVISYLEPYAHLINLVSINEGVSYMLVKDEGIREFLARILHEDFTADTTRAGRLWLRKEIMKSAIESALA